jgi:hypothetical protein
VRCGGWDCRWAGENESGSPNFEMDEHSFATNRERAVDYLNVLDRIYVFDGFAGWDPKVPTVCKLPGRVLSSLFSLSGMTPRQSLCRGGRQHIANSRAQSDEWIERADRTCQATIGHPCTGLSTHKGVTSVVQESVKTIKRAYISVNVKTGDAHRGSCI